MDQRPPYQREKPEQSASGDSSVPLWLALMLAWLALIALALTAR